MKLYKWLDKMMEKCYNDTIIIKILSGGAKWN